MKQNIFTGKNDNFYNEIKNSIKNSKRIDIIVSFLMESGVELILNDLKNSNAEIRILTSTYLNITQPHALYMLKNLDNDIDLRFYKNSKISFHPKAYIFYSDENAEIYVGSSNLSKGGLTTSVEWNYHFTKNQNRKDFEYFSREFDDLFNNHSIKITDKVLKNYSSNWIKPKIDFDEKNSEILKPHGAQIEALYNLDRTREENFDKALIVAATGIGKTYISAFDSINYDKILFIAHREEIIKQAAKSFKNIHKNKSIGFFYNRYKETDCDITFALVQTLGKQKYLNDAYFKSNHFDYIIIDEFHHAVASNYSNILNYFKPKFLLGLTATPERLDNKDVFALCDYNNVYEIRLKEAINKGFLSPFRYYGIYDFTVDYDTIEIKNGKYDEKDLEEKLMIHKRAELVLNHYLKYNPERAIGFCSSRNHAEYMAEYFNAHSIASAAVYSGQQGENTEERKKAINKLKNKEITILFAVDMFNEGLDVPEIDTVLFLRPTESPTIFLQQLGRGLRKSENKKYLTVLDFIGNYKKSNMAPFLLSNTDYDSKTLLDQSVMEFEYPEDCFIDFDFKLVDFFKLQASKEVKIKDRILIEFESVQRDLKRIPARKELMLRMDENIIQKMKRNSRLNLFRDYLKFLKDNDKLTEEEKTYTDTIGHEFLKTLETTSMTKSYKIPILLAFFNNGDIKMEISDDDVYQSMKRFYEYKSNGADMIQHKNTKDYLKWSKKDYVSLAKRNPIKFLNKSAGEFFIKKEGCILSLNDELEDYIHLESFKNHFKDIIEYKTLNYYKERNLK